MYQDLARNTYAFARRWELELLGFKYSDNENFMFLAFNHTFIGLAVCEL